METKRFSLTRDERLKSQLAIDTLFSGSNPSITIFPLKVVYRVLPDSDEPSRIMVSVSKRYFKRAVHRNRIKRQVRESYRLEKHLLPQDRTIHMAFLWLCNRELASSSVRERTVQALQKINKALS